MKASILLTSAVAMFCSTATETGVELTASNIRAAQRPNSKLVDIDYDVSGGRTPVFTALEISSDNGTTWSEPTNTLTGAVGNGVSPSRNLRITWNGELSTQTKFRLKVIHTPSGMSFIPPGTFQMGDPLDGERDAPILTVTVSAFYIEQTEVTKAMWDEVLTWGLTNGYTDLSAGEGKANNHPVRSINWFDMLKWCNARSEKEGLTPCYTAGGVVMKTGMSDLSCIWSANGYRLPTEAEWEKAARGGLKGKRFPWGDTINQSLANYFGSTSRHSYDLGPHGYNSIGSIGGNNPATSPVGSFAENAYGLHDVVGNVYEWCWDWYGSYPSHAQTDPKGVSSGSLRVARGGSWYFDAYSCRTADRGISATPSKADSHIGFRVARSFVP